MSVEPIKRSISFFLHGEEIESYPITLATNSIVEYLITLDMPRIRYRPIDDGYLSSIELSGPNTKSFKVDLIKPTEKHPTSFGIVFKTALWGGSDVFLVMKLANGTTHKRTLKVEVT
ncbi:hypothetical protein C5H23_11285 [Xylella fastidiosa]|nr:hypothetical protein [Xylella fastidiosa]TNV88334.1 hypothetical protein C5H23_11285 [Xylella fastidiosa]TNV93543.1 hypothetical protein C5H22_10645 [Xylella fastidiosa]TNV93554.1 hypothetical protein C5H22_10605 [Xylella fastidiosa]TNV94064.1 hypothetical protein C5H22_09680 [Xylella fastidiosa]TNV94071.1 hypothetical protein C5H22_09725 [Xylella fastidiosa]